MGDRLAQLRIAVIGAGHMGSLHAEKLVTLEATEGTVALAGIADLSPDRARDAVSDTKCPRVTDHRELLPYSDAVIVSVPTVHHASIVDDCLSAGLDVLVEKPIAASVSDAAALLRKARDCDRLIQVGHVEWFNPAMRVVAPRIVDPSFIECHRLSSVVGRAYDIDVVRDLMIHDIDIAQRLLGEEPCRIDSVGFQLLTSHIDFANARLTFPGGCVGNFTASRVSSETVRKIRLFQRGEWFSIDFIEKEVEISSVTVGSGESRREINFEDIVVDHSDALVEQLRSFVNGIRERRISAGSGHDALAALRTAIDVVSTMRNIKELP